MMETATQGWRGLRSFAPWLIAGALPSGAVLFALLLWLSHRFLHEGFGEVRQHAFAPIAGTLSLRASVQRNWWSCTCVSGACACLSAIARGLRRCCEKSQRKLSRLVSLAPSQQGL